MTQDFSIDQKPEEVLRLMEGNLAGNQNYQVIGAGWLTYKAGELNSKATGRLTFATYVLAGVALCQLIALVTQIYYMFHPPHP